MFAHFTFGTQATTKAEDHSEDAGVSPKDTTVVTQTEYPSPAVSPAPPLGGHGYPPSAGVLEPVDDLAQQLGMQNLQLEDDSVLQSLYHPAPSAPFDVLSVSHPPCPELELDDEQHSPGSSLLERRDLSSFSLTSLPLRLDVDDEDDDDAFHEDDLEMISPDSVRARRQLSSHFHNNPVNARTIQNLVEGMIATSSQYAVTVHHASISSASGPPPTPSSATGRALEPILEPNNAAELDLLCMDLEVDDAYCGVENEAELILLEHLVSLRRASGPSGIRKGQTVDLVKRRPKMRRKDKAKYKAQAGSVLGPNSRASSTRVSRASSISATMPSPAMAPMRHGVARLSPPRLDPTMNERGHG